MTKLIEKPNIDAGAVPAVKTIQPLGGKELMSWTIKAFPLPMLAANIGMGILTLLPAALCIYGQFGNPNGPDYLLRNLGIFGVCLWLLLWKGVGRKNLYHYRITSQGGEVTYWMDFPDGIITFFKWLSGIFFFVVLCMIAVEPSFIWMLVGPAGMAIGGARILLSWKKEVNYERFSWNSPNWIFTDKKRKLVVVKRRYDPDIPFEENYLNFDVFLPTDQIEIFVQLAKQYTSPGTDFEEGRCKH